MKFLAIGAAMAALVAVATPASAQMWNSGNAYAGLGYTHYDSDAGDLGGVTGRLGYHFTPHIGAEAEYTTGVKDADNAELDNAWGVYGVGTLPLSERFDVFGRVGYQQINVDGTNGAPDSDSDGVGYGVGANFHVTDRFSVRGEYTRLSGGDDDVDSFGLGGAVSF